MILAIVPDEMADLDKMLLRALRREEWLPRDLARDVMKLEKQLLKSLPRSGPSLGNYSFT